MRKGRRRLRISLIGAGSVGTALAVALHEKGHSIVAVVSRHRSSAQRCAKLVQCRQFSPELSSLPSQQDLILIATPEDAMKPTVRDLWRLNVTFDGTYVAHTSGVFSDDILRSLRTRGARTFSLHPIQTFPGNLSVKHHVRSLKGISFGVTSDRSSLSFARGLVRDLGGKVLRVPKEAKILYHLACVFASNFPIGLLGVVEELTREFSGRGALSHFRELVHSSVTNALSVGPQRALTGPIVRGSSETVKLHLLELKKKNKNLIALYRILGFQALKLASKQKRLSRKQIRQMKRTLKFR
ncbi:MAG: DUF2520 domain-containing protein [Ignavibacteriales bacterium]|nr:DUF2520 domain-containing protein [Ignavibacteriales bacterium]